MKEEEIRPQKIFNEYLRLAQEDTVRFFADLQREKGPCPACGAVGEFAFTKYGFDYETCPHCQTLFVNPRPVLEAFARYYQESPSSEFWATTFYKKTAEARRDKIWKPKAKMVRDALIRYDATKHAIIDIGGGYGLFAEEMQGFSDQPITIIEPSPHLAKACREKSLFVVEKFLEDVSTEDLPVGSRVFTSFELFEHLHNPVNFMKHLRSQMNSGDIFIFTTLSGTGVDIQMLWEKSKSVHPPHHLNFLNPDSIKILFERIGLEILDISTPGKLDIEILVNNRALIRDRFWRTFTALASEAVKEKWQDMIAGSGWSSHMMVICRRE